MHGENPLITEINHVSNAYSCIVVIATCRYLMFYPKYMYSGTYIGKNPLIRELGTIAQYYVHGENPLIRDINHTYRRARYLMFSDTMINVRLQSYLV